MNWTELDWNEMNGIEFNKTEMNWTLDVYFGSCDFSTQKFAKACTSKKKKRDRDCFPTYVAALRKVRQTSAAGVETIAEGWERRRFITGLSSVCRY